MNSDINENTIIVKHIPKVFSLNDCQEFFSFFKSKSVTYFNKSGPMQHTAIVTFTCYDDAYKAIFSLHERKILNNRLCAQFLKVKTNCELNSGETSDEINKNKDNNSHMTSIIPDWVTKLLSIAPKWGLNSPIQPKLKYNYPKPNNIILTNIIRTLIANENFYLQTLHLMNKFHFPAPFNSESMFPGNISVVNNDDIEHNRPSKRRKDKTIESIEMEISSGNESEISDDENITKIKRRKLSFPKIPPNPLATNYDFHSKPAKTIALNEVFEGKKSKGECHIEFRPISSIDEINDKSNNDSSHCFVEEGFGKIDNVVPVEAAIVPQANNESSLPDPSENDDIIQLIDVDFKLRKGKICEASNVQEKPSASRVEKPIKIMSFEEIKLNILPKSEWQHINALKNYKRGVPSNQLYVKNISKKVSKDDIINLYGGFVDWSCESEVASFQVTYFTEGRMKGQAFVSFASQSTAERALEYTNAYNFHDKPIAVLFSKNATC